MFPVNFIHEKAQKQGLPCLVLGGHFLNVYCEPRATLDVDFLVRKAEAPRRSALLTAKGLGW